MGGVHENTFQIPHHVVLNLTGDKNQSLHTLSPKQPSSNRISNMYPLESSFDHLKFLIHG